MKFIAAILLLTSAALAQLPNPTEIQNDFKKTFDFYEAEAIKFVAGLAAVLDGRVSTYNAAHQKLVTHFTSVKLVPGVVLDAKSDQILANITARIQNLISNYPKVLDRNIFNNEMQKHLNILKDGYLKEAQALVTELASYVSKNPEVGKCWQENRDELLKIVENGFLSARDAALTTLTNANATLNTNEVLINALITSDKGFIELCKAGGPAGLNGCINFYLTIADATFGPNSLIWESTTNSTVAVNLQVAESLIRTATAIAVAQVTSVVHKIQICVTNAMRNFKPQA